MCANDVRRGIRLMLFGAIVLTLMDATSKSMGTTLSAAIIVCARFTFQALFLLPFVARTLYIPRGRELISHLIRALFICVATTAFFAAIQVMPLTDALAIFFLMPMIVAALAHFLLDERIGWRRVIAIVVGFIGVIIVIGPSQGAFGHRAYLPLVTAFSFASYVIITRVLAAQSNTSRTLTVYHIQFFSGVFGAFFSVVFLLIMARLHIDYGAIQIPTLNQWFALILVGLLSTIGHIAITSAYRYAPASHLAPFQYFEIITATILGYVFFDDVPTFSTFLGVTCVVGAGLFLYARERTPAH